jgi:hypothetical protein
MSIDICYALCRSLSGKTLQHFPLLCGTLLVPKGGSGERGAKSAGTGLCPSRAPFQDSGVRLYFIRAGSAVIMSIMLPGNQIILQPLSEADLDLVATPTVNR